MTPDRKPAAALWITVALVVVLVGYPLSFGPVWRYMSVVEMAAKVASHPWSIEELYEKVMATVVE